MLWLCLFFPSMPVELRGSAHEAPLAVVDRERGRRVIVAANLAARAEGVEVGLDATVALAREPRLQLVERSLANESRAFKALASWATQFSSEICFDAARWLLWIEVGGSLRYFHGLNRLRADIAEGLATLGYCARMGVSPTIEGAALLARTGESIVAIDAAELRAAIGVRPLTELALSPAIIAHLTTSGLVRIEQVIEVPSAALARRFGSETPLYIQRLIGALPDPRPRFRAPDRYRRRYECPYPIDSIEGLQFPLRRLLQELEGFLRGRDSAIQLLTISIGHRSKPDTVLEIRTTSPQRECVCLFALLRERLERTTLREPALAIRLSADQLLPPTIVQSDLFTERSRKESDWNALLDKLKARLGDSAIRQLGLADDHRPEHAWVQEVTADLGVPADHPARPLWLLDPTPIERVPTVYGTPERIEAGWWTGDDSSRDYYLACGPDGARLWLYRDAQTQRWFLQGIWG